MKKSKAPSMLLMGPAGAGKTSAIATYALAGIDTYILFTEPGGEESLIDSAVRLNIPIDRLHWHTITAPPAGWNALRQMAMTVRSMAYEDLAKLKQGIGKQDMKQLEALLEAIADFPDDRTGLKCGDVTTWDDSRAFVLDSLSGLNQLAYLTTVGYKPTAHEGEWGTAMNLEEQLLHKLTSDCGCYFTLIAHIDREPDPIMGGSKVMPAALGRKLAPKLGKMFGDVVRARRATDGFWWSTVDNEADLKNRALPVSNQIKPEFVQVVNAHLRRKKLLLEGQKKA